MRLNERLAWTDWLGLVWVTLLLGLGMAGLQVVVRIALIFVHDPIDVMVPTSEVGAVGAPDRLPPDMQFETGGWIPAQIVHPTLAQGTLYALTTLPTTLVLAGILLVLLRVVKDAWDRNPFSIRTIRRLRLLGATPCCWEDALPKPSRRSRPWHWTSRSSSTRWAATSSSHGGSSPASRPLPSPKWSTGASRCEPNWTP